MKPHRPAASAQSLPDGEQVLPDAQLPAGPFAKTIERQAEEAVLEGEFEEARRLMDQLDAGRLSASLRALIVLTEALLDPRALAVPARSIDLLLDEAALVERDDPELASLLLAEAAVRAGTGDDIDAGRAIARRAQTVAARAGESAEAFATLAGEVLATLSGHGAPHSGLVERVLRDVTPASPAAAATFHRVAVLCLWNEDFVTARALLERLVEFTRGGPRPSLPLALDTLASIDMRTGRWTAAEGRSSEALRLALELGQDWLAASCNTTLAGIAAVTGREEECRTRVQAALGLAPGSELVRAWAATSLASLELSLDRPGEAVAGLESLEGAHHFATSAVPLLPILIEAYVREGRPADAIQALAALEADAGASRHLGTLALAARCRGLVAGASDYRLHFEEAITLHTRLPTPFERARTELLFGERLRRGRHRAEAQPVLRSALATFERLGAVKWAERARRELAAMRRRSAGSDALAQLTAHELEVASLVVRGATNREAARALFVAEKTIEYHLGNIYAKLAVRSRTELTRLVLRAQL